MSQPLSNLALGARARVTELQGAPDLQQRLMELGLLPGMELSLIRRAPLGDPLEIELLGYHLSLRQSEAAMVKVEELG